MKTNEPQGLFFLVIWRGRS